jgi:lysozyme
MLGYKLNITKLGESLVKHEGLVLGMYDCPAGFKTIGVGHNLEARPITEDAAMQILHDDIIQTMFELDAELGPWWHNLEENQQLGLIEMAFQLGARGVAKFTNSMRSLRDGAGPDVIYRNLMDSNWARQTPARAQVVAKRIATGEW